MTKKITAIICDDEPLALKGMKMRLEEFPDVEIVRECRNGREGIAAIKELKPDLAFLDIQMPGLDGFAVVKSLVGSYMPLIVFVTAYDQYALEAFNTHALDYLLKPVEEDRLEQTIERVRETLRQNTAIEQNARIVKLLETMDDPPQILLSAVLDNDQPESGKHQYEQQIHIKDRGYITRVEIKDIDYIDAAGDYMCIHTGEKTHILRATMKTLEKKLDPGIFQRVHRSAIVNLNRVKELHPHSNGEYFLVLEGGQEIKVSRSYKDVIGRFVS